MKVLLRFKDLRQYGITNYPTLARWIKEAVAPAGFFLGPNTRAWYQDDWDAWLANRPSAAPPNIKPAASLAGETDGRLGKSVKHPLDSQLAHESQAFPNGRAR